MKSKPKEFMMRKFSRFAVACAVVVCAFIAEAAMSQEYTRNGLIAQWDAIDNSIDGNGTPYHDSETTVWKDLSGNGYDLEVSNGTWGDASLTIVKGRAYRSVKLPKIATMEVCMKAPSAAGWGWGMNFSKSPKSYVYFQTSTFIMTEDGKGLALDESVLGQDIVIQYQYSAPAAAYLNGKLCTGTYSDNWGILNDEVNIGGRNSATGSGTIYAIRLYGDVLTESDRIRNRLLDEIRFFGGAHLLPTIGDAPSLVQAFDSRLVLDVSGVSWPVGIAATERRLALDIRKPGEEEWRSVACDGTSDSASIDDLEPGTEYEVRLRAWCVIGDWTSPDKAVGSIMSFTTAAADPTPAMEVDVSRVSVGAEGLTIPVELGSFGSGATALTRLALSVGFREGECDYTEEMPVHGLSVGTTNLYLKYFRFDTCHYVKIQAENEIGGKLEKTFSVVAPAETFGSKRRRGLWQVKFKAGVNCDKCKGDLSELSANPDAFDALSVPEGVEQTDRQLVEGAIMAEAPLGNSETVSVVTSEMTGRTYTLGNGTAFAYYGYMSLTAGRKYVFGGDYYDSSRAYVDNEQVMYQSSYGQLKTGEFSPAVSGWYPVRLYVGHISGSGGKKSVGLEWKDGSDWKPLIDADGTLFAVGMEDGATESVVAVDRLVRVGNRLIAKVRMTDEGMAGCRFYVVTGKSYGGMDAAFATSGSELVKVDERTALCDITVPEGTRYVRLAAVATCCGELATCWAPAVRWQDTEESAKAPPMILSAKVDTHNADDEVVVGGKILSLGSGTSLTVTVDGVEKAALVDDTGAYAVGYSGLDDTVTHQAKVVLSDEYGTDNIVLDEFTFSRVVALDGDLSLSAAQTDQRTVIASIFVSQLGVGESYAVLLSGTTSSDLVEVQRVRIEQVGSLAMLLEDRSWGETLACKIVLETVLKGETTAISTAVKSYTVNDVASYTWKSTVPEGNWGDSANWQSSLSSCIGYPSNISSRALFPAAAVRIKVDARYPIKEFCFGSNMTLWSDDTNKCAIVASDNTHLNSGYSVTFDHVVFSTPYRLLYGGGSLALTNGANVSFGRDLESSDGGRIVIDDSHLSVANVISCSGSTIELRGKSPVLTLTGAANGIVEKVAGKTSQVVFDIPSDGYAQPPIVGSGKSVELFANGSPDWMKLVGTGSATAAGCNHQPLIVWDGGVATSNLTTEVVGVSHGYFEYSEKIQESFKPWKDKPEGLSVRTVGFSAGKRGLVIMLR